MIIETDLLISCNIAESSKVEKFKGKKEICKVMLYTCIYFFSFETKQQKQQTFKKSAIQLTKIMVINEIKSIRVLNKVIVTYTNKTRPIMQSKQSNSTIL